MTGNKQFIASDLWVVVRNTGFYDQNSCTPTIIFESKLAAEMEAQFLNSMPNKNGEVMKVISLEQCIEDISELRYHRGMENATYNG